MSLDDILKKLDAQTRERMSRKVPSWSGYDIVFPSLLSTEQCSGEAAARYKASVASIASMANSKPLSELRSLRSLRPLPLSPSSSLSENLYPTDQIADLTGGLGVDSWAFSKCFDKVLYNESNAELAAAVKHNFGVLGCDNIVVSNKLLEPGNLCDILGEFNPDVIFLDPARRSSTGKKVFLLEDCQPDVLALKEELLAAAPLLLLKLSPMADITMLHRRLGQEVTDIHVVAFDGECKELLVLLQRGYSGPATLTIHEDGTTLSFPEYYTESPAPFAGRILYEPGKSLTKAGLFDYPCSIGYKKLAKHTHLYIAPDNYKVLPGKYFKIEKVLPLQSRTIKELSKQSLAAEVSCHNIPITSEDLRKRLRTTSSGVNHIFAASTPSGNILLFTSIF